MSGNSMYRAKPSSHASEVRLSDLPDCNYEGHSINCDIVWLRSTHDSDKPTSDSLSLIWILIRGRL